MMPSCPRWVTSAATREFEDADTRYPEGITEAQTMNLPKHIGATYEECGGDVECHFTPGEPESAWGDYGATPGEPDDVECSACDSCGAENWTDAERAVFLGITREAMSDNYDGPDDSYWEDR